MIQATQFRESENKQGTVQRVENNSPLKVFVFCTLLGALIGPFVVHQQVMQTIGTISMPVAFMTAFIGSSVGGISGLLIATMADVIFTGRLEESSYVEEN